MQVCDALHTDMGDGIGEKQEYWNREKKIGKKTNIWKNQSWHRMGADLPLSNTGISNKTLYN